MTIEVTKEALEFIGQAEAIRAANAAIDAGSEANATIVALPDNFKLHNLEDYLLGRGRARGRMATTDVVAFADYAKAHAGPGATVFVDPDRMQATAVLNLGDAEEAGHADNVAVLTARKTAAYSALLVAVGKPLKQTEAAEFIEDWSACIASYVGDSEPVSNPKAIAAIRRITIEAMRKVENSEQSLSASRSAFESVQASSAETMPTLFVFTCLPYHGLPQRSIALRLGVQTGGDKPLILLRLINKEQHEEDMARELGELVETAVNNKLPVLVGSYQVGS